MAVAASGRFKAAAAAFKCIEGCVESRNLQPFHVEQDTFEASELVETT